MIAAGSTFQRSDGSELALSTKPQADGVPVAALARAWPWQKLLDQGVYSSVTEVAEAERTSKSYVSRALRLTLLTPDIVEAILAGTAGSGFGLEQLQKPLPASWDEQRRLWATPLLPPPLPRDRTDGPRL